MKFETPVKQIVKIIEQEKDSDLQECKNFKVMLI